LVAAIVVVAMDAAFVAHQFAFAVELFATFKTLEESEMRNKHTGVNTGE
jgi:hypothetical protein